VWGYTAWQVKSSQDVGDEWALAVRWAGADGSAAMGFRRAGAIPCSEEKDSTGVEQCQSDSENIQKYFPPSFQRALMAVSGWYSKTKHAESDPKTGLDSSKSDEK